MRSARAVEGGAERVEIGGAEDHTVARRDVNEVEVDARLGDLAGEVRQHPGVVLDVHHDDLTLTRDGQLRDRERMLRRLGMWDENVQLGTLAWTDAGRSREVYPCVAHRSRHAC